MDLTAARESGKMWDFSLEEALNFEECKIRSRSCASDDSMVSTCVKLDETSRMKTGRIEPQIRTCVQACKLQMEMQKHFIHEHPKGSTSWKMPEVQSVASDPRVYSMDGPMCRWSIKARGSKDKEEFTRKQTRWLTRSEIADVLRGDGRWKDDRRHVHMSGKSEAASEYPASLVEAMLGAIKRQMMSDGAIRVGELHFTGPVPDESDYTPKLEGTWRIDGTWIDPKRWTMDEKRK